MLEDAASSRCMPCRPTARQAVAAHALLPFDSSVDVSDDDGCAQSTHLNRAQRLQLGLPLPRRRRDWRRRRCPGGWAQLQCSRILLGDTAKRFQFTRRACATVSSPTPRCAASTARRATPPTRAATPTRYAYARRVLLNAPDRLALQRLLVRRGGSGGCSSTQANMPSATALRTRLRRRRTCRAMPRLRAAATAARAALPPQLLCIRAPARRCTGTPRRRARLTLPKSRFIT